MKSRIMYIEHKTNQNHRGDAWIGLVEFSKSGRTIYFNGKAFKKALRGLVSANYYDVESGDLYWISGVKKNGHDRHQFGAGKVMIDKTIVDQYLELVDFDVLDKKDFELVDIQLTDKANFEELENRSL